MPTKTTSNPALTIISIRSLWSDSSMDACVLKPKGYFLLSIHSIMAGRTSSFSFFLFPIKLSSTKKTPPLNPDA
jgi:hypothetical protein